MEGLKDGTRYARLPNATLLRSFCGWNLLSWPGTWCEMHQLTANCLLGCGNTWMEKGPTHVADGQDEAYVQNCKCVNILTCWLTCKTEVWSSHSPGWSCSLDFQTYAPSCVRLQADVRPCKVPRCILTKSAPTPGSSQLTHKLSDKLLHFNQGTAMFYPRMVSTSNLQ
jgi:hypothetical protein